MKRTTLYFRIFLTAGLIMVTIGNATGQPASPEPVYAFEQVKVIPMDEERVLDNQTVIVRGDRIIRIGASDDIPIPAEAQRIDGRGQYLMPGLAEMHGHIPPPNLPDAIPAGYTEDVLFLYLAGGITTVRGMLGFEGQLELKEQVLAGNMQGPTLYLAGPSFNGNSISSPEQAEQKVRTQNEQGWDLLKVHPGLTREEYDAMARTAHEVGIPFGGHIPEDVGLVHALEMGQQTIDHLDGYIAFLDAEDRPVDKEKLEEAVRRSKEAGVWVVPTMALWETLIGSADYDRMRQYPEIRYMPEVVVNNWNKFITQTENNTADNREQTGIHAQNRLDLLKALNDGDVPVLMGTDAPQIYSVPGFSIHRELAVMKQSGMSNYDILQSGTFNVGMYFKDTDAFGTVTPGQRADLLLLQGNPLDDLEHLKNYSGIMVRGQWLSKEEINSRLDEISSRYRTDD